jgi:uncharacterized membrane protein YczE
VSKSKETTSQAIVEIRKAPKFTAFVAVAAALGLVISSITAWAIEAPANFFGYVIGWGTVVFASVGLIVALVVEAIFRSRTKRLEATKIEG